MKLVSMKLLGYLPLAGLALCLTATAAEQEAASQLLKKYTSLEGRLHDNQFMKPVVLESSENGNRVTGEIFAVISHPFATVREGLDNPGHWCDILSLHINTKYCRAVMQEDRTLVKLAFGKKTPQRLEDASRLEFNYTSEATTPSYLDIKLDAKEGALGTSDFLIDFEAVPLPDGNTFLHFTYSYATSFVTRFATNAYLATVGTKPGFTISGTDRNGEPQYLRGTRGIMERNTMRYYLAIESFFAANPRDPAEVQLEERLQNWFTATEQYAAQLHEMDRDEYIEMKRAEYERQQTAD